MQLLPQQLERALKPEQVPTAPEPAAGRSEPTASGRLALAGAQAPPVWQQQQLARGEP